MSRPEANEITIGQLSRETGLTLRTLRFYEEKGLLKPRRAGTTRLYSPAAREHAKRIVELTGYGFSLFETGRLLHLTERELEPHLRQRLADLRMEQHELAAAEVNLTVRLASVESLRAA